MVLDVPGFVAELFQADEVVDGLPRDAGERHLADEVEEDDLAAFAHELITSYQKTLADNG